MDKRTIMLVLGALLVGGFFLARRASAATPAAAVGFGASGGDGGGGGGGGGGVGGALGTVPFTEVTFPGGGLTPLAFEGTALSNPVGPGSISNKGTGGPTLLPTTTSTSVPSAPSPQPAAAQPAAPLATPIAFEGPSGGGSQRATVRKGDPIRQLV